MSRKPASSAFEDEDDDVEFIYSTQLNRTQPPRPAAHSSQRHPASFGVTSSAPPSSARPASSGVTSSAPPIASSASSLNTGFNFAGFDYLDYEDDDAYRASAAGEFPSGAGAASFSSSSSRNPVPWRESVAALQTSRELDEKEEKQRLSRHTARMAEFVNNAAQRMRDSARGYTSSLQFIETYLDSAEGEAKNAMKLSTESLVKCEEYSKSTSGSRVNLQSATASASAVTMTYTTKHERNAKAFEQAVTKYGKAAHDAKRAVDAARAMLTAAEKKAHDVSRAATQVVAIAQKMTTDIDEEVAREITSKRARTHGHAEWDGLRGDSVNEELDDEDDRIQQALQNLQLQARKSRA